MVELRVTVDNKLNKLLDEIVESGLYQSKAELMRSATVSQPFACNLRNAIEGQSKLLRITILLELPRRLFAVSRFHGIRCLLLRPNYSFHFRGGVFVNCPNSDASAIQPYVTLNQHQ